MYYFLHCITVQLIDEGTSCPEANNMQAGQKIEEGGQFDPFRVWSLDELSTMTHSKLAINAQIDRNILPGYNPYANLVSNTAASSYPDVVTDLFTINGQYQPIIKLAKGEMRVLRMVAAFGSSA